MTPEPHGIETRHSKYVPRGVSPLPWSHNGYGYLKDAGGSFLCADDGESRLPDAAYAALAASTLGLLAEALERCATGERSTSLTASHGNDAAAMAMLSGLARAVAEIDGGAQ